MKKNNPKVTIVVVPRERFSFSIESLKNIYDITSYDFDLIYVDGKSPGYLKRFLERYSKEKGFKHIRTNYYLHPNQARNVGFKAVSEDTEYVIFLDNDVLVRENWLTELVKCAEETSAALVGPLYLEGDVGEERIHMAGGKMVVDESDGIKRLSIDMHHHMKKVSELEEPLERFQTDNIEFHAVLVRKSFLDKYGPLDDELLTTREHVDICLIAKEAGLPIYLEPKSVIHYVYPYPLKLTDFRFHFFRWDKQGTITTIKRFEEKWSIHLDKGRVEVINSRKKKAVKNYIKNKLGLAT